MSSNDCKERADTNLRSSEDSTKVVGRWCGLGAECERVRHLEQRVHGEGFGHVGPRAIEDVVGEVRRYA